MRKLLLLSILLFTVSAHAQDLTKPCEKAIDALAATTAERDSLKTQLQLTNEKLALTERMVAIEKERGDMFREAALAFKTASGERATANETDALRIDLLRSQVAEYKIELDRARREVEKLRASRKYWMLFGTALGAAGTYVTTK